ncbi:MAG TPA: aminoacyl-tRNA hydrolase [Acidiferrobacteraceae bacterium]|nr:aminoacyl-tRNA hydrolase [Acidiferrobacteraceae bacterium]
MAAVQLIVGLGNPGAEYEETRHNAGFRFVAALCETYGAVLEPEARFKGHVGRCRIGSHEVFVLMPATFMNRSGESVGAFARFYKVAPEAVLVAHDELDLPLGTVRLKQGGGTGGHNGLASIEQCLGSRAFARLRLGIGRPPAGRDVIGYVLGRATRMELQELDEAIARVRTEMPELVAGEWQRVMGRLHTSGV